MSKPNLLSEYFVYRYTKISLIGIVVGMILFMLIFLIIKFSPMSLTTHYVLLAIALTCPAVALLFMVIFVVLVIYGVHKYQ